jgi:cobalt/nickel transport system permease protein
VQAVVFADGGILAFGANVLNMAVVGPFLGALVWKLVPPRASRRTKAIGAFAAAWAACVAASLAAGLEVWISGRASLPVILGAMGFWHALIGVGEGLITAGLVTYVASVRPDLLGGAESGRSRVKDLATALAVLAIVAAGLSFLASGRPDGLEFVYFEERIGAPFEAAERLKSPMPDYVVPGIRNETVAGVLAGIVGVIVTGALLYAGASAIRRRRAPGA